VGVYGFRLGLQELTEQIESVYKSDNHPTNPLSLRIAIKIASRVSLLVFFERLVVHFDQIVPDGTGFVISVDYLATTVNQHPMLSDFKLTSKYHALAPPTPDTHF